MSGLPPRTPPRFVPTLTERVELGHRPVSAELETDFTSTPDNPVENRTRGQAIRPLPDSVTAQSPPSEATSPDPDAARASTDVEVFASSELPAMASTALSAHDVPRIGTASVSTSARPFPKWVDLTVEVARTGLITSPDNDSILSLQVRNASSAAATNPGLPGSSSRDGLAKVPLVGQADYSLHTRTAVELEETFVHRVLQRVDVALDKQLLSTVSAIVDEHIQTMLTKLTAEIESVVRGALDEAIACELAARSENKG